MPKPEPRRKLDTRSLIALAHPLRLRIRDRLRRDGAATATQLAREFAESSGATSYHLRMLARHGLVEPDPGHTGGRERWWRATPGILQMDISAFLDDDLAREALRVVTGERQRMAEQRLQTWHDERERWTRSWRDVAEDSIYVANLTPEQLAALGNELTAVIDRYVAMPATSDTRSVEIQLYAFPTGDPS